MVAKVITQSEAEAVKAACSLWNEQQIASARMHRETPRAIRAQPLPEVGLVSIAIVYETSK
jgi:hypothetical protein